MARNKDSATTIQLSTQALNALKRKKPKGESYEAYLRRRGVI